MAGLPIYYINLASRPDRRALMEEQFGRLGLAATRIEAVTPAGLPAGVVAHYGDSRRYKWMAPTELACAASHGLALQAFLDSGATHGLILEDDSQLSPELPRVLAGLTAAPAAFDVLRVETTPYSLWLSPWRAPLVEGIDLRRAVGGCAAAGAYIVNRRAAKLLLEGDTLRRHPIDAILYDPYGSVGAALTVLHCDPAVSVQMLADGSIAQQSNIEGERRLAPGINGARPAWLRLAYGTREFFERDVYRGIAKAWQQFFRGARKEVVPYYGGLPAPARAAERTSEPA